MHLSDQGIILSTKKYSENSLIVKILSKDHGIYSGFVRSGQLQKNSPKNSASKKFSSTSNLYQNFNLVDFEWSSKIEDNLGFFKIELQKSFLADIISNPIKLSSISAIGEIIEQNVLEREPVNEIFSGLLKLLKNLDLEKELFLTEYIKFEIELLQILGYGIDLSECAATGATTDLHFVSPKSARAVCAEAGEKYRDKLLILPQFLLANKELEITKDDLLNGLKLSGFFIEKYLAKKPASQTFSQRNLLLNLAVKI